MGGSKGVASRPKDGVEKVDETIIKEEVVNDYSSFSNYCVYPEMFTVILFLQRTKKYEN